MSDWELRDYDPATDEAPEGDPKKDCVGGSGDPVTYVLASGGVGTVDLEKGEGEI